MISESQKRSDLLLLQYRFGIQTRGCNFQVAVHLAPDTRGTQTATGAVRDVTGIGMVVVTTDMVIGIGTTGMCLCGHLRHQPPSDGDDVPQ